MTYLLTLFFLENFIIVFSFIIQPKGPTHRNLAIKCIKEITKDAINFTKAKYTYFPQFMLTYVITRNLSTPAYNIQEEVLKQIHSQNVWSIEVFQDHRNEFKSYEENCNKLAEIDASSLNFHHAIGCIRRHVKNYKTKFYIMVVENLEGFNKKIKGLARSSSFSSEALYLIYVSKLGSNNISIQVLSKLREYSAINSVVMVPANLTTFNIYQLRMDNVMGSDCYSKSNIEIYHQCIEGSITKHDTNLFKELALDEFRNCIVTVHAISYEPFVINQSSGIEIDILGELGKALNISFEIETSDLSTYHWGEKDENGEWTGFVAPIFNFWHWGIGNIAPDNKFISEFTYSVGYYSEKIVWVVPIAGLIPRWRVLMAIFTMQMWGICLAVILGFAVIFYFFKDKKEVITFRTFEKCFLAAFELFIGVPVPHQPIIHFTRVFFIALAIFGIIINSVYTSSLVYYLQNPIRERQISTNIEIATSGLMIGGPPKYKETFIASTSPHAKQILNRYQTVNDSRDTYMYWLNMVANKKNMATFSVKLCVTYLISKKRSIVTDGHGDPKVYILPKAVMSQSIGIMMRRGAFGQEKLNSVIQKFIIEAGVMEKIKSDYIGVGISDEVQQELSDDNDNGDNGVAALTTHHLEGAFAILALGHAFGLLTFILEIVYFTIRKNQTRLFHFRVCPRI